MDVIILAGGKGTRLKSITQDVPKPMADINGRPFLEFILNQLIKLKNLNNVILSVGYRSEQIIDFFGHKYKSLNIIYSIETSPLGTGGAIKQALSLTTCNEIMIMNGDTLFDIDFSYAIDKFRNSHSDFAILLKLKNNFDRYGTVKIRKNKILLFKEKQFTKRGLINSGIYFMNKKNVKLPIKDVFSFEDEFLNQNVNILYPIRLKGYFIDIGIPEDYYRFVHKNYE